MLDSRPEPRNKLINDLDENAQQQQQNGEKSFFLLREILLFPSTDPRIFLLFGFLSLKFQPIRIEFNFMARSSVDLMCLRHTNVA